MRSPLRDFNPRQQVIHIQPLAAAKPPMGAVCNGCGLCCLAEPCPLGVLLSRSRKGPCKALQWLLAERQYRCGALGGAIEVQVSGGKGFWQRWQRVLQGLKVRLVLRWIAAGAGCDCDLEPAASPTISDSSPNLSDTSHD